MGYNYCSLDLALVPLCSLNAPPRKVGFLSQFVCVCLPKNSSILHTAKKKDSMVIELAAKQLHVCYDHLVIWLQFKTLTVMRLSQLPITHGVMNRSQIEQEL